MDKIPRSETTKDATYTDIENKNTLMINAEMIYRCNVWFPFNSPKYHSSLIIKSETMY